MKKEIEKTTNLKVPFGRYKGQPLDILSNDPSYLRWLLDDCQDFKNKYKEHYTFIINNFSEPNDTPEHNDFHVQFLDNDYCYKFLKYYGLIKNIKLSSFYQPYFEPECGGDVLLKYKVEHSDAVLSLILELKPSIGDDFPSILRAMNRIKRKLNSSEILLMKQLGHDCDDSIDKCLLIRNYHGETVSLEQVKAMFRSNGIPLIQESEFT